jgi:rare lipoprotein A (peptidoglycan hydrolase)
VSPSLVQRFAALAAVALLAAVVALAISGRGSSKQTTLPQRVPAPGGGWYHAVAGVSRAKVGTKTACGHVLRATTKGVADPVLPCGAKIFIAFGNTDVLTQVIDRGPSVPGRRFELTGALADQLGVRGVQPVRWAFAR